MERQKFCNFGEKISTFGETKNLAFWGKITNIKCANDEQLSIMSKSHLIILFTRCCRYYQNSLGYSRSHCNERLVLSPWWWQASSFFSWEWGGLSMDNLHFSGVPSWQAEIGHIAVSCVSLARKVSGFGVHDVWSSRTDAQILPCVETTSYTSVFVANITICSAFTRKSYFDILSNSTARRDCSWKLLL